MAHPIPPNEDHALRLVIWSITWAFMSLTIMSLRMFSRIKYARRVWWDDYFVMAAMVSADRVKKQEALVNL